MRLISFALTTGAFLEGRKTVTRRQGWKTLKPGTVLGAVRKGMGLKKGQKVDRLGVIEVVSVRREVLDSIGMYDVRKEAVDGIEGPNDFVTFYSEANRCARDAIVTRIEFRYVLRIRRYPYQATKRA